MAVGPVKHLHCILNHERVILCKTQHIHVHLNLICSGLEGREPCVELQNYENKRWSKS
jgi:hypothetical protein